MSQKYRYKDWVIQKYVQGYSLDIGVGRLKHGDVGLDIYDYGEADVIVKPREEYPFDDNTFDTVICSEVLEHSICYGFILDEAKRVLKPNGRLIISIPNSANILYLLGIWKQPVSTGEDHMNYWSKNELMKVLNRENVKIEKFIPSWYRRKLYIPFLNTCNIFICSISSEK